MSDFDLSKGPDPQADATLAAFNQAAGVDQTPGAAGATTIDRPSPEVELGQAPTTTEPSHSFAHAAAPDPRDEVLKQDFDAVALNAPRPPNQKERIEQPRDPELKPSPPPEFQLPPDLQALNARLTENLAINQSDELGLKNGRGMSLTP